MRTSITITELTRMHQGRVCVAGYDERGKCIRPVLPPPGISEQSLCVDRRPQMYPFAVVEYNLTIPTPQPPHVEDYRYDPRNVRFIRVLKEPERATILQKTLFPSVADIFEQPVHSDLGFYVMDGVGPRSLGTIMPGRISRVIYAPEQDGAWDYRLLFNDAAGCGYRLKIVDLTWHYYCDRQRGDNCEPRQIADMLTAILRSRDVFLRIGLSRGWSMFPDRCYLQVTGIHTFPDYLGGMTFADLAPRTALPAS
jgi:hypothetical protein